MKFESKFDQGQALEDHVSGFVGIVTTVRFHIDGETDYYVEAPSIEGALAQAIYFDESRLKPTNAIKSIEPLRQAGKPTVDLEPCRPVDLASRAPKQ